MKHIATLLLLVVVASAAFFYLRDTPTPDQPVATTSSATIAATQAAASGAKQPPEESERPAASGTSVESGFIAEFNQLQGPAARGEPVAVERFISLLGACESVRRARDGATAGRDFERMREYCDVYTPGMQPENLAKLAESALPQVLEAELRKLAKDQGNDAVASRLDELVAQGDPHVVRAALDYAAESGIVPSRLQQAVAGDPNSQGRLAARLGVLAHIEFCRNGGACGANDFETLGACVALGPCHNGDGLLDVIRRATPPADYQAALALSSRLHGS